MVNTGLLISFHIVYMLLLGGACEGSWHFKEHPSSTLKGEHCCSSILTLEPCFLETHRMPHSPLNVSTCLIHGPYRHPCRTQRWTESQLWFCFFSLLRECLAYAGAKSHLINNQLRPEAKEHRTELFQGSYWKSSLGIFPTSVEGGSH